MSAIELKASQGISFKISHITLGIVVFTACLLATVSKSPQSMSFFWFPNALMLGLMLRFPVMAQPGGWGLAIFGHITGSYIGEEWLLKSILLSMANIFGVAAGWLYLRLHSSQVTQMSTPTGVFRLLTGILIASAVEAFFGAWVVHNLTQRVWLNTLVAWFSSEIMYMILTVPVLLNLPKFDDILIFFKPTKIYLKPICLLLFLIILSYYIGGPGARLFVLPGLILCALSFSVFAISVLCFFIGVLQIIALAFSGFDFSQQNLYAAMSMRMGLTMMSVTMLTVACARKEWRDAIYRLEHISSHDSLTGMLNRAAFIENAQRALDRLKYDNKPVALLMLDLDWFKRVNDTYGHNAGDQVLKSVGDAVIHALRPNEILGRLGGEEFALLLQDTDRQEACATAARLCAVVRSLRVVLDENSVICPTMSVGVAVLDKMPKDLSLGKLLKLSDIALYAAKDNGRDGYSLSTG